MNTNNNDERQSIEGRPTSGLEKLGGWLAESPLFWEPSWKQIAINAAWWTPLMLAMAWGIGALAWAGVIYFPLAVLVLVPLLLAFAPFLWLWARLRLNARLSRGTVPGPADRAQRMQKAQRQASDKVKQKRLNDWEGDW